MIQERELSENIVSFCIGIKQFSKEFIGSSCSGQTGELTADQFKMLVKLNELEKTTLKDLSSNTSTSSSSLCIMLDRFVRLGYAERETDSKDRRRTLYSLSNEGRALLKENLSRVHDLVQASIADLPGQRKRSLQKAMEEVSGTFNELLKLKKLQDSVHKT